MAERTVERFSADAFFSGARRLELRTLPLGARITSARFVLTPMTADGFGRLVPGIGVEVLDFAAGSAPGQDPADPARQTGVIKTVGPNRVELAFDTRRIVETVRNLGPTPPALDGATMQIDIGGVFVPIDARGVILTDGGTGFTLATPSFDGTFDVPPVLAQRVQFSDITAIDIDRIELRAIASNVRLAIGGTENAFVRPGDLLGEVETPDLSTVLQLALDAAEDTGTGTASIPVILSIDGTGHLAVTAEIEFERVVDLLGPDLEEARLDFAFDGTAQASDDLLTVQVPAGMQIARKGTSIGLNGGFEGTEIARGPLAERAAPGSVALSAGQAFAQPFADAADLEVDALDLLVATDVAVCRLQIDIRDDFDGKPAETSALPSPAALTISDADHATAKWASARLSTSVQLLATGAGRPMRRRWLVTQCLEGQATLLAGEGDAAIGAAPQISLNGGLSWRAAEVAGGLATAEQLFRLRRTSPVYKVPVTAEIGRDAAAERIALDAFQPLGRVEFTLDGNRVAPAANRALATLRAADCPRGEQLANGRFTDRLQADGAYAPVSWFTDPARPITVASLVQTMAGGPALPLVYITGDVARAASQVLTVAPGCDYELSVVGLATGEGARVELIWRDAECGAPRVDTLQLPRLEVAPSIDFSVAALSFAASFPTAFALAVLPTARLRVVAPEGVTGLEVRLIADLDDEMLIDQVSLIASPSGLRNPDFLEIPVISTEPAPDDFEEPAPAGWTVAPAPGDLDLDLQSGAVDLANTRFNRAVTVSQTVQVVEGATPTLEVEAVVTAGIDGALPTVALLWQDGSGNPVGEAVRLTLGAGGAERARLAPTPPPDAAELTVALEMPARAELRVVEVALTQAAPTAVPVSFLAEAPGALTLRDVAVAFEPAPQPPPVTPEEGLCSPTPADQLPGEVCEKDPACKCQSPDPAPVRAPIGRPVAAPPATVVTFNDRVRALSLISARRPIDDGLVALRVPPSRMVERFVDLMEIREVGPERAERLLSLGLSTPRLVAASSPALLSRRLSLAPSTAERIVGNARLLLSTPPEG
ncbi:MAG: helix-hairpin-helix domain-containing protein [Pseudomonadota bacterium]